MVNTLIRASQYDRYPLLRSLASYSLVRPRRPRAIMQPHKRGRGRPSDGLYVSRDAPDCQVRKNGRPAGGTHGPSRTTQQMGVAAAAEARRSASEVGAIGDEPNDAIGGDEPSHGAWYGRCRVLTLLSLERHVYGHAWARAVCLLPGHADGNCESLPIHP